MTYNRKTKLMCLASLLISMASISIISCATGNTGIKQGGVVGVEAGAVDILERLEEISANINTDVESLQKNMGDIQEQMNSALAFKKEINNSGTIKYSGGGWIVLSAFGTVFLFLFAVLTFVWIKYRTQAASLNLVTTAVHGSDKNVQQQIKNKINHLTSEAGPAEFKFKHKAALAKYVKTNELDAK